jgi:hypothetical protein
MSRFIGESCLIEGAFMPAPRFGISDFIAPPPSPLFIEGPFMPPLFGISGFIWPPPKLLPLFGISGFIAPAPPPIDL